MHIRIILNYQRGSGNVNAIRKFVVCNEDVVYLNLC